MVTNLVPSFQSTGYSDVKYIAAIVLTVPVTGKSDVDSVCSFINILFISR